jgi:hypothetical protein
VIERPPQGAEGVVGLVEFPLYRLGKYENGGYLGIISGQVAHVCHGSRSQGLELLGQNLT